MARHSPEASQHIHEPVRKKFLTVAESTSEDIGQLLDVEQELARLRDDLTYAEHDKLSQAQITKLKNKIKQFERTAARLRKQLPEELTSRDFTLTSEKPTIADLYNGFEFTVSPEDNREIVGTGKEFIPEPIRSILKHLSIEDSVNYIHQLDAQKDPRATNYRDMVHRLMYAVVPTSSASGKTPDWSDPIYLKLQELDRALNTNPIIEESRKIELPPLPPELKNQRGPDAKLQMKLALGVLLNTKDFRKIMQDLIADEQLADNPTAFLAYINSLPNRDIMAFEGSETSIEELKQFLIDSIKENQTENTSQEIQNKNNGIKSEAVSDFYKKLAADLAILRDDTEPLLLPRELSNTLRRLPLTEQMRLLRDNEHHLKFTTIARLFSSIIPKLAFDSQEFKQKIQEQYSILSTEDKIYFDYLVRKMLVDKESSETQKLIASSLVFIIREHDTEIQNFDKKTDVFENPNNPTEIINLSTNPRSSPDEPYIRDTEIKKTIPRTTKKPAKEKGILEPNTAVTDRPKTLNHEHPPIKPQSGQERAKINAYNTEQITYDVNEIGTLLRQISLSLGEKLFVQSDALLLEKLRQNKINKKLSSTKARIREAVEERIDSLDTIVTQQNIQTGFGKKMVRFIRREKSPEEILLGVYKKILKQMN